MRTTQRQNILRHLLGGPLCGVHDDWELGRRIAARIHELRETGFAIETVRCTLGHNHRTPQRMYKIKHPSYEWTDYCAHCGRDGTLTYTGERWFPPDDDVLFEAVCGRCGKKDYR